MAMGPSGGIVNRFGEELEALRRSWVCFLALGITLIVLGIIGLGAPLLFTLTTVTFFGVLLLFGGIVEIASAIWAGGWRGLLLHLLAGILYLIVGVFFVERPGLAAAGFTLMLAIFFIVSGAFRIVVSLTHRFPNWGWVLVNGIITFLLGVLIWRDWPEASLWVIGLFVGLEMLFNGWSWVMLALMLRGLPKSGAMPT